MHACMHTQYCAKVMQANFDKIPGSSWLFKEISIESIFQRNYTLHFHDTYCFNSRNLSNDNLL